MVISSDIFHLVVGIGGLATGGRLASGLHVTAALRGSRTRFVAGRERVQASVDREARHLEYRL